MPNLLKPVHDLVAPNPETLWARGGGTVRSVEINAGRYANVPFFDVSFEDKDVTELRPERITDHNGVDIGEYYGLRVETSDGIDRAARYYRLDDEHRADSDMYIHIDTAWMTPITGHNDYVASRLASLTGLDVVVVGAEHSTNKHPYPQELLRLGKTAMNATGISLAKSAQASQAISAYVRDKYTLPTNMITTGESRGSMLAPAQYPYASEYGNTILYSDTTAPCVPERLFINKQDSIRLAAWLGYEAIGGLMLGAEIFGQQAMKRRLGTVALNPNFITSNLIGVGPALFSGEFGVFAEWVPDDAAMFYSTFKNDLFTKPDVLKRLYQNHPNVYIRTHRSGTHATLANDRVIDAKAMRINAFGELYEAKHDDYTREELAPVFALPGRRKHVSHYHKSAA